MSRWRVLVHALDRTGPPMLARSLVRWLGAQRPDDQVEVVAFRGGAMLDDLVRLVPTHVVLDPHEPWDHGHPEPARLDVLRQRLAGVAPADATLLVSVAAAQLLPFLDHGGPVVTWVVERGEDLHWLEGPLGLTERTARWLVGARGTGVELAERLGPDTEVHLVPEFVEVGTVDPGLRRRCRRSLGVGRDELLVVGAGIATPRKAPDLFVEVALAARRLGRVPTRFVWIGGEQDEFFWTVRREAERLGPDTVRFLGDVPDVDPWLAAADVVVHPARLDAFPLVCLHAARLGTPVVAFAGAGGLEEMFGRSFVGRPYPDVAGLATDVVDLAEPAHRQAVAAAQAAATLPFSVERAAPAVARHLDEVAGVGAASGGTGR